MMVLADKGRLGRENHRLRLVATNPNRPITRASNKRARDICGGRNETIQSTSLLNMRMDQRHISVLIVKFCRTKHCPSVQAIAELDLILGQPPEAALVTPHRQRKRRGANAAVSTRKSSLIEQFYLARCRPAYPAAASASWAPRRALTLPFSDWLRLAP